MTIGRHQSSMADEYKGYNTQNPSFCWSALFKPAQTLTTWWADFFGAAVRRPLSQKKTVESGSPPTSASSASTTTETASIRCSASRRPPANPSARSRCSTSSHERQVYLNVAAGSLASGRNKASARKEQEFRDLILKAYRAEPLPDAASSTQIRRATLLWSVRSNLPVGRLFVEEVITECRQAGRITGGCPCVRSSRWACSPAVPGRGEQKGIDLRAQNHPARSLDKRAVEKARSASTMCLH